MKIAIIGSGISGLTAGYLLSQKYEVHLFEAASRIGGHSNTIDVELPSGKYAIDTGFIVFNDKNYPCFNKLISKIGIERQKSFMSFSVKVEESGLEYNGTNLNSLFCQRKNILNPSFYRMIRDILRFNKEATKYYLENVKHETPDLITIEDYLHKNAYSKEFLEHYIMPMGAALWSASREEMRHFPLNFFVRFFHHHGMLSVDARPQWYVLKNGSRSYIPGLTKNFSRNIYLDTPVKEVNTVDGKIRLLAKDQVHEFDHVIFASHADQTLSILKDASTLEKEILGSFSYRPNDVLLHTDTSILPKSKLGWASWNYFIPKTDLGRVAVTYDMNILQSINAPETFLVSLNMDKFIDPKKVIKKIAYSHPVFDTAASNAQKRWSEISGKRNIHFCGAYWGNGFHEDGAKSAFQVCKSLGVEI